MDCYSEYLSTTSTMSIFSNYHDSNKKLYIHKQDCAKFQVPLDFSHLSSSSIHCETTIVNCQSMPECSEVVEAVRWCFYIVCIKCCSPRERKNKIIEIK